MTNNCPTCGHTIPDLSNLVEAAKKDLEIVNKAIEANDFLEKLGLPNYGSFEFKVLLEDCKKELQSLVDDTVEHLQYEHNGGEPIFEDDKWNLTSFSFFTHCYDNCGFDFIKLWSKLIGNTKNVLESLGTEVVRWATSGWSGDFDSGE